MNGGRGRGKATRRAGGAYNVPRDPVYPPPLSRVSAKWKQAAGFLTRSGRRTPEYKHNVGGKRAAGNEVKLAPVESRDGCFVLPKGRIHRYQANHGDNAGSAHKIIPLRPESTRRAAKSHDRPCSQPVPTRMVIVSPIART